MPVVTISAMRGRAMLPEVWMTRRPATPCIASRRAAAGGQLNLQNPDLSCHGHRPS
jgi:hypothetical protein